MLRNILLTGLLLSLLGGCMSMRGESRVVIMQDPKTMDFVNCDVGKYGLDKHFKDKEKCVEEYKAKGYIVWGTR